MLQQFTTFGTRVLVNAGALWLAAQLGLLSYDSKVIYLILTAILLALLNAIIKPALVILSLPAIVLTQGLFTILINGFIIVIASWLFDKFNVESFWYAMLVGLLVGLVNYVVTLIMARVGKKNE